jgi:DNA-binding LacI/PurR family transcriptional regulator
LRLFFLLAVPGVVDIPCTKDRYGKRLMTIHPQVRALHPRGSPIKYVGILNDLRCRILTGELTVNERLPTHAELAAHLRTTTVTVKKALDVLAEEGLVRAEGSRGTFVAEQRPARAHYALTFPWGRLDRTSRFYEALHLEAAKLQSPECQVSVFHDIEGPSDTDDYRRLMELIRSHRLAGVIFAARPHRLWNYPVLAEPGIPRVVIAAHRQEPEIPTVYPDIDTFMPRALDHLAAAGRKRVAVLKLATDEAESEVRRLRALAKPRGLLIEPHWVHAVSGGACSWARQTVRLLFHGSAAARPDALVIADDNLVPEATAGLRAAGVRTPGDALVIAHANFPYPTPAVMPVTRLGFDIRPLLGLCMERLEQQRRGEKPPAATMLPARFEDEREVETEKVVVSKQRGEVR